jgi:protein MpaA
VLLIGAIHGDEPEGLPLIERLGEELTGDLARVGSSTVLIIRNLNPDGTAARKRSNAHGVDLNRNLPASNWEPKARSAQYNPGPQPGSEPETAVLLDVLREFEPQCILVMHATRGKPMVNYDGPARDLADDLSRLNGYVTSDTIGYATPGSLGSYAGIDLQIPIITLELPREIAAETAWRTNREALYRFVAE